MKSRHSKPKRGCVRVPGKESWQVWARPGIQEGPRRSSAKSARTDPHFSLLRLRDWFILGLRQTRRFPPVWPVSQAEFRQGPPQSPPQPNFAAHAPTQSHTPTQAHSHSHSHIGDSPLRNPTRCAQAVLPHTTAYKALMMKHTCRHQGLLARTTGAKSFDNPLLQALSNRSIILNR